MKAALAACAAVVLALTAPGARAADLSGVWVVDETLWRQQLDRMIGAMVARMPPELRAQMQANGVDPAAAFRNSADEGWDAQVEFLPSGKIRTTSEEEPASEDGSWQLDGEQLEVSVGDAEGLEKMVGTVDGDRITLKPVLKDDSDPDQAVMREMIVPLVRKR